MKKFKKMLIIFAFIFMFVTINQIDADEKVDYKKSGYVISQEEADKMIEEHGKLVQSSNDKAPDKEYQFFMGYDPISHEALWTNKISIQARAIVTKNIKTVGTWRVGSYWGERMQDSDGNPVYCGTYGANYPVGSFKYVISESTKVRRALSWGYNWVNTNESANVKYGKTQLALWKGQGKNSVSASTLGVYQKVADAYKGKIGANAKTFTIPKGSAAKIINNINMSNSYAINGTASFKFTSTQLKKVSDKDASLYIYNSSTKKWIKVKANTNYSNTTYSAIRMGTTNLKKDVSISNLQITANQPKDIGYVWKIENPGYQDIFSIKKVDPVQIKVLNFTLKAQVGSIKVLKLMDDTNIYDSEIEYDGKAIYKTKDGNPVMFKTELGELSLAEKLRYATKDEFEQNDGYEKPYQYPYLDYDYLTEQKQKLDENNQPILIIDENGVAPGMPGYIETYEMEEVNVIDSETGYPVVEAKKDAEGNYIYANATTSFAMPSKEIMENDYKAEKSDGVEFTLYKNDKKTIVAKSDNFSKGELLFDGLLKGTYYVKETKTKDGFTLKAGWYKADVSVGKTITINNSKVIINEKESSDVYISKTDATGELEIDGGQFELYDSDDNLIDEWIGKAGDPHYVKLSKGTYYIKEVVAPLGYDKKTTLIPINIDENGQVLYVKVKNELIKADLEVSKVDITNSKELEGAKICIYNPNNEEFVIGVDGQEKLTKKYCWTSTKKAKKFYLYYGKYVFEEVVAPKGYQKKTSTVPFSVDKSGIQKHNIENAPIKYTRTGGINYNALTKLNKTYSGFNTSVGLLN